MVLRLDIKIYRHNFFFFIYILFNVNCFLLNKQERTKQIGERRLYLAEKQKYVCNKYENMVQCHKYKQLYIIVFVENGYADG